MKLMVIAKNRLPIQMQEFIRQIEQSGEEMIITEQDVPVLRVIPISNGGTGKGRTVEEVFGKYQGLIVFHEDPDEPSIDEWEDV